jgi:iron complex outermembrane receptor protein
MIVRNLNIAMCLAFGAAAPASAQQRDTLRADSAVFRLTGIAVHAVQPVTSVGGTSAIVVRLDSLSPGFAPRMEQVLRDLPMINVRTNSRGEAELTLRGSESRQVAVLLDGVPLTLQWDARTDVSVVPATAVQELTFTRGLSSMLFGPNVLGGVVEVSVGHGRSRVTAASATIGGGFDQYGGYGSVGTLTVPFERESGSWLVRAGLGFRDTPGSPLAAGIEEPVPASDPGLRRNTDMKTRDGFFSARWDAHGGAWFSLSGSGFDAERGVAAELTGAPRLWRYPNVSRYVTVASAGTGFHDSPFGGRGDLEFSVGVDGGRTEIDSYATPAYDEVIAFENGDDRTVTLRLLGDQTIGSRADLRGAFTLADIFHREILPGEEHEYQQRLLSFGGETIMRVHETAGRRVTVSAGGAVDIGTTPKTGDKPSLDGITDWGARAGVTASLASGTVMLHGGVSRRGRFPALRELYSGALNRFQPNPDLTPEHLTAVEGGITTRLASTSVQAVVFHNRLNDAIVRVPTGDGRLQRVNRDELRSTGLELLASRAFGRVSVAADLTLQTVDLIDPSTSRASKPENQPATFGSVTAGFPLALGMGVKTEVQYTGSQYCIDLDSGQDTRLDAGTHINADLARVWNLRPSGSSWFSRLETRVAVDNIADTAIFDQCGLPQPGRLVRFEVRVF